MKKIVSMLFLLSTTSIVPMTLKPLIKNSVCASQKLAAVGQTRNISEYAAIIPAVIVGAGTLAHNFKLVSAVNDVEFRLQDNFTKVEITKLTKEYPVLLKASRKLSDSSFGLFAAGFIGGFGAPNIVWVGASSYFAVTSAIESVEGMQASKWANKKIDELIQQKKDAK